MKGMATVYRTRQYRINSTHNLYSNCRDICGASARLYNRANFILRQYSSAVKAMDEFKPLFSNQMKAGPSISTTTKRWQGCLPAQ